MLKERTTGKGVDVAHVRELAERQRESECAYIVLRTTTVLGLLDLLDAAIRKVGQKATARDPGGQR